MGTKPQQSEKGNYTTCDYQDCFDFRGHAEVFVSAVAAGSRPPDRSLSDSTVENQEDRLLEGLEALEASQPSPMTGCAYECILDTHTLRNWIETNCAVTSPQTSLTGGRQSIRRRKTRGRSRADRSKC